LLSEKFKIDRSEHFLNFVP